VNDFFSVADPAERISAIFWAELFFSVTISRIRGPTVAEPVGSIRRLSDCRPRFPTPCHLVLNAMKALVTGGAGFIGSHLTDALVARGDEVLVIDDLSTGRRENLSSALDSGANLEVADITETRTVVGLAEAAKPEVIFHLAAQMDVRRSVADPAFDAHVNVAGTANLLEAARLCESRRFVLASTGGAIYGEGEGHTLPMSEDDPARPQSPYGQSKLAAEGYVGLYRRLYGVDGASLRFGNVYGPRQDPHGEAGVVAIFCGKLRAGERPSVFGSGEQTRDYVHVGDTVEAILAAGSATGPGPFNIGTGRETSVLELISILGEAAEAGLDPIFEPAREGEVERISIDPARAREAFGWSPGTDLIDGLKSTYEALAAHAA
jgi:UDP-glucose 4-epimerase